MKSNEIKLKLIPHASTQEGECFSIIVISLKTFFIRKIFCQPVFASFCIGKSGLITFFLKRHWETHFHKYNVWGHICVSLCLVANVVHALWCHFLSHTHRPPLRHAPLALTWRTRAVLGWWRAAGHVTCLLFVRAPHFPHHLTGAATLCGTLGEVTDKTRTGSSG